MLNAKKLAYYARAGIIRQIIQYYNLSMSDSLLSLPGLTGGNTLQCATLGKELNASNTPHTYDFSIPDGANSYFFYINANEVIITTSTRKNHFKVNGSFLIPANLSQTPWYWDMYPVLSYHPSVITDSKSWYHLEIPEMTRSSITIRPIYCTPVTSGSSSLIYTNAEISSNVSILCTVSVCYTAWHIKKEDYPRG